MNGSARILIIGGYGIDGESATSITLRNIFSFFPHDQIAFLMTRPDEKCSASYKSKVIYRKENRFVKYVKRKNYGNIRSCRSLCDGAVGAIENPTSKRRILNYLHSIGYAFSSMSEFDITSDVDEFIRSFKPNLIYTLLGSVSSIKLCEKLSIKYNLKVIPHFMDDWISTLYTGSALLVFHRMYATYILNRLLKKVPFGFVISEKMANEYHRRYKCSFFPLMNCVKETGVCIKACQEGRKTVIIYAGGLHLNRVSSLLYLCKQMACMSTDDFVFYIYTSDSDWNKYRHELSAFKFVVYGGFLPQNKMLDVLSQSDILVHLESFDKKLKVYTKYSISTKIPEYLSCKKIIIAIGPSDIASIEYLQKNRAAFVIDSLEKSDLYLSIRDILSNQSEIDQLINNAYDLYKKNHDQIIQQQMFLDKIETLLS